LEILSSNPYRTLGVTSNSGQKLIQKNLSKLKAYSKLGKSLDFDYDFSFLSLKPVDRSIDVISKVESKILLDENKIKFSLFWFQETTSFDSIALANLTKGNAEKASVIWSKVIKSDEVNSKNFSAVNNISTLLLISVLEGSKKDIFKTDQDSISKLKSALNQKINLIKSDCFNDFCLSVGAKSTINSNDINLFFSEKIIEALNKSFSTKQILDLIDDVDASLSELYRKNLIQSPVSNIKEMIETTSLALKNNVENGLSLGKELIKSTVKDLKYLKETLGENHHQYHSLADKVSNQVLQCGINYFNEMSDDQSYLSSYKYALSIATSDKTKTRANECIKHCEEEINAKICKFCNENEVSKSSFGLRLKMHKMTGLSQYSYFKNGGLEVKCCNSCKNKKSTNKIIAPILALVVYGGAAALTSGVLVIIDFFTGFNIGKWWFKFMNKKIYFESVSNHPLVKESIRQGYEYGMP
jgi:hypothetical protein